MIHELHYKPEDYVDELLGRYYDSPKTGLFNNIDTILVGNNLLIAKKDVKKLVDKLFTSGYIVDSVYYYKVSKNTVEKLLECIPNFDTDTEYFYPSKDKILACLELEQLNACNYVEIIAGTVNTEY